MKKLFFIYTNPQFMDALYRPVMSEEYDGREDVKVYFMCDNSLLADSLANDAVPTGQVETRLGRLIDNCVEAGADCIVVGCTVMNPATARLAAAKNIPVLNIDDAMARKVWKDGVKRAAVLSHARDNAQTVERRLHKYGVNCELFVIPGAAEANRKGDREKLGELYREAAGRLGDGFDGIVLAHISADRIEFPGCCLPVYRSGELCIREINEILFK